MIIALENGSYSLWVFLLVGGLLALLIAFAFVVVHLYRKFKRRY
jgi:hypothetical protein